MKCNAMNETPERNGDAVNELTAGTWQYTISCFIFFCTIERVAGCGGNQVGCVGQKHGFTFDKSAMVLAT